MARNDMRLVVSEEPMDIVLLARASEHGDKAYVFVQPNDQPPFIIEDERCIFPSDALMAKLALLEKK